MVGGVIDALADVMLVMEGGYHALTRDEIKEVFRESLAYA